MILVVKNLLVMINNQNDDDELLANHTHFQYLLVLVISYRKIVCHPICTAMLSTFSTLGHFVSRFAPAPKRRPHVGCWPYSDQRYQTRREGTLTPNNLRDLR